MCNQAASRYGERVCCGVSGARLDQVVAGLVLAGLAPAALEVSIKVSEEVEREREKVEALWQKRLQRARYEVDRAAKQYHAADPENRLVTRTLEGAWEEKLKAQRDLQEEYERSQQAEPRHLTAEERDTIRSLATDLPSLWNAPTTSSADRKTVVRLLLEQVSVVVDDDSEWVDLTIRWAGGHETKTKMRRPVGKLVTLGGHKELLETIRSLRLAGFTAGEIATKLNQAGWVTPTQRNTFNERLVRAMILRYGPMPRGPKRPPSEEGHELWLSDLAAKLEMPTITLYGWLQRGWAKGRHINGKWAVASGPQELRRLRQLRRQHPSVN
jgi:hypothetical protein